MKRKYVVVAGAWLALLGATGAVAAHDHAHTKPQLAACPTEDWAKTDCYWDAQARGNGEGWDFVVINHRLYRYAP